jgi:hypothetical protein
MGVLRSTRLLVAAVTCAALLSPIAVTTGEAQIRRGDPRGWRDRDRDDRGRRAAGGPWTRDRRGPIGYQEPAYARGFSDGYERGLNDGRDRDRYDPVGERDYRDGDNGYFRDYGSRDAYRNNYRAGFRQGYEDGYRDGQRYRR